MHCVSNQSRPTLEEHGGVLQVQVGSDVLEPGPPRFASGKHHRHACRDCCVEGICSALRELLGVVEERAIDICDDGTDAGRCTDVC